MDYMLNRKQIGAIGARSDMFMNVNSINAVYLIGVGRSNTNLELLRHKLHNVSIELDNHASINEHDLFIDFSI
jgi:hypothetical protein